MTIEEFEKFDLRIGKVVSVEYLPHSKKLLKIFVDIGESEPRQILSGVRKVYDPTDLVGKTVMVVANLDTRLMGGVESNGMLMGIEEDHNGLPLLLSVENDVKPGMRIS
jgi:methionine--tRNA ligase beta chain